MTPATRLRVVATAITAVGVGVLVGVRITSDEPAVAPTASSGGPTAPTTTVAEPPLDDPPSAATARDLGGIAFTDATAEAGLDAPHTELELTADLAMTSGAAVADVDADGWPDVYVTRIGRPNSLYRNQGDGTFVDIAASAGVDRAGPGYQGSGAAAFGDIDADGCVDLYVAGVGNGTDAGEAVLFRNDCNGRFTDETDARGVALPPAATQLGAQGHGATFADFDLDGHLDLLVLHWDPAFLGGTDAQDAYMENLDADSICPRTAGTRTDGMDRSSAAGPNRSRLFRNDGTGRFLDVTATLGLPLDQVAAFTGDFIDMDDDGWPDLVLAGDFCTSRLFRNVDGQRFEDVSERAGVGTDENGMGSVVRDVNGDGRPDWFVTSIDYRTRSGACPTRLGNTGCSGNRLYLNEGDGRFSDATDEFGVRNGWWGWGAAIEDFGNDGRLGIVQANGYFGTEAPRDAFITDPLRFWVPQRRSDERVEASELAGLTSTAVNHALVPFDHDGDGDLDVLVANHGVAPTLYRNDTPTDRHWVRIRLDRTSTPGNRAAVGAKVRVTPAGGDPVWGWISTGGSYESQKLPELHVGLGDEDAPIDVTVWWPGDPEPQTETDVAVDRVATITER